MSGVESSDNSYVPDSITSWVSHSLIFCFLKYFVSCFCFLFNSSFPTCKMGQMILKPSAGLDRHRASPGFWVLLFCPLMFVRLVMMKFFSLKVLVFMCFSKDKEIKKRPFVVIFFLISRFYFTSWSTARTFSPFVFIFYLNC